MKHSVLTQLAVIAMAPASLAAGQNSTYTPDKNWVAPAEAAAQPNPVAGKPDAIAAGRRAYLHVCAECHGEDGTGLQENAANLQLPEVQKQSDGTLFWKISKGNPKRGMPAFSRLPDMERWHIVSFLRTFKLTGARNHPPVRIRPPALRDGDPHP